VSAHQPLRTLRCWTNSYALTWLKRGFRPDSSTFLARIRQIAFRRRADLASLPVS
jgi:hypothetical protein